MTQERTSGWRRGSVIYQVYPRSFADTNGDGVGDLPGITQRLDHIASLGVDAVWLSPFFPSPMADFGYDVADYCGVDPLFGTLEDFDRLVDRAHALGLKIIIDQVYCHTSDQHPWFVESRAGREGERADWYVWADAKPDGSPPSNWQSVFGGPAWTWDARRGQYYMHNFLAAQPQLNLHQPAVQDALLDAARFWLDRGVDGFRLDAINFAMHDPALTDNPPAGPGRRTRPFDFQRHLHNQSQPGIVAFLERLRALTDTYGGRFTVAEVPGEDPTAEMKAFTAPGRLSTAYGFDFLYAERLDAGTVRRALEPWAASAEWPAWAFSNHDAPRCVSRWAPEGRRREAAELLTLLLMSLRGEIFLYQGEELGLPQAKVPFERLVDPEAIANWPETLGRDGARTPMPWRANDAFAGFSTVDPWLPVDSRHPALAVDAQESEPASMLQATRRLVGLRRREAALREGDLAWIDAPAPLVAFERRLEDDRLLCLFNPTNETVAHALPIGEVIESVGARSEGRLASWSGLVARRP